MTYILRDPERLALRQLEHHRSSDLRPALLLEGPPGCGKTALAAHHAEQIGGRLVYGMLHAWSDADELFAGVNVVAAVAGDAARVHQPGVIAVAAEASQQGPTVLCLDEIDKAPERVEALLLDVLQTGRVPVRPGEHLLADPQHLRVMITSNAQRELSDALLRRCIRVRMQPLSIAQVCALLDGRAPTGVISMAAKAAVEIAKAEGNSALSLQEIGRVVDGAMLAQSYDELREIVAQNAARRAEGHTAARKADFAPLWGQICAERRKAAA